MPDRRIAPIVVLLALLACAACGGSHETPTAPSTTPSTPVSGSGPTVRVEIKVDDRSARDAVLALTDVVVDASASSGTGSLTFSLDYGDGFSATTPTAHHSYAAAGNYTITVTVTDGQARKSSDSRQMTVKSLVSSWFEAEYVERTKRVEIRRLTVTAQDGLTIRGRYEVTGAANRSFTGTLIAPRSARFVMDDGATLEGVIPDRLNDTGERWTLQARGDTVDGSRLEFRALVGEPPSAAPDAVMKLQFGDDDAALPIAAMTPIQIDGSTSRGSGLNYFIEFGDGSVATNSQATRVVDRSSYPWLTARLTVVDQYGRSDSESTDYSLFELGIQHTFTDGGYWPGGEDGNSLSALQLTFRQRTGVNYVGMARQTECGGFPISCTDRSTTANATLGGNHDIRIVLPVLGVTYTGTVEMVKYGPFSVSIKMYLLQSGGGRDGKRWTLLYRDYY